MSASTEGLRLSPQEALARDLIMERVAARHRAHRRRHPSRAALWLRSLADRLDHTERADGSESLAPAGGARGQLTHAAAPRVATAGPQPGPQPGLQSGPHAGQPRPWSATVRRAPHRHS